MTFDDYSIYGHLFPGPDTKNVPDMNVLGRDILFASVGLDPPRFLRCQAEQGTDCLARCRTGAQLKHLP